MISYRKLLSLSALPLVAALAACGPSTVTDVSPAGAGQEVGVAVAPPSAQVAPGGSVAFRALVTGTVDGSVDWVVVEASGGTVDAAGVYTAPKVNGTYHVRARSKSKADVKGEATVTVTAPPPPVSVTVSPASPTVDACRTVTLTASVTGSSNGAVTWSVAEGATGGTITSAGVYGAPAAAGTYHAVATSQADPTRTATATIVVAERVLSMAVSPADVSLPPGGSAQFTATVTTTCGTSTATRTVTAPL